MVASKELLSTGKWLWRVFPACKASERKQEARVSAGDGSTFKVQCYIYARVSAQRHTRTNPLWNCSRVGTTLPVTAGGVLRQSQATHGILCFRMLSELPSSSRHFGNTLTLATPDFQQRVWADQLFLVKRSRSSERLHINKDCDLHNEPHPRWLPTDVKPPESFFKAN